MPAWARPDAMAADDRSWIARLRAMTTDERDALIDQACEVAESIAMSRPDRERVLLWQEPLPAESESLLARLRARARGTAS